MTTPLLARHVLPGFRPEPLASYLAGLGLIRLLGEQADPKATAAWTPDGLVIATTVPDLAAWLADEYLPTPVLSPWNGGSGFGAGDDKQKLRLEALRNHPSPRLDAFRNALQVAEAVGTLSRERGWIKDGSDKSPDKRRAVRELRNRCPEELLPWIDAAVVLTDDSPQFPPILGTGGNDGRLEFSTNFHASLLSTLGPSDAEHALSLLRATDLLTGTETERLIDVPVGQFDPGKAGGPGSSQYGSADSRVNPWGYVLCVEGALLFAASTARRHLHGDRRAAIPFTVEWSPDGSDSGAASEESHGEVWAPLWMREFTLAEIRQLFAEARASWRGRPARRAVDFYAAIRTLGVARGIDEFVRYGMQQRNGRSHTAIPIDRVVVREEPAVQLAAEVEDWVARVGTSDASISVGEALRGFRAAHLGFARDGNARRLADMLAALTTLEQAVGRSGRARDAVPARYTPPADKFLAVLRRIERPELRVAVGMASCSTQPGADAATAPIRTMRQLLLPVDPGGWRDSPLIPGFGVRPLENLLTDVLVWRSRTAVIERGAAKFSGVPTFRTGIPVPAADLHSFARGELNGDLLDLLLRACLALNWRNVRPEWAKAEMGVPDTTLGLLQPLAAGFNPGNPGAGEDDEPVPALAPDWAARLAAGQVRSVHNEAASRLRQAGWTAVTADPEVATGSGARIAAALVPRCLRPQSVLSTIAFRTNPRIEELS